MREFELFLLKELKKNFHVNTNDMVKLFNFTSSNYVGFILDNRLVSTAQRRR